MTLKKAEQLLDNFMRGLTATLGFESVEMLIYSRPVNESTGLLAFPCRIDPRGPACFTCSVWLRFESLERYLRDTAAKPSVPTISMPLHLLREDTSYTEWQFYSTDDLERLRDTVERELVDIALPFHQRYSDICELRRKLESETPADWFILGPEGRLNVLATIQFVQGDKEGALKLLDQALLERKSAMPSKRLRLEAVRKRLAAAMPPP